MFLLFAIIPAILLGQGYPLKGRVIDLTTKEFIPGGLVKIFYEDYTLADTIRNSWWYDLSTGGRKDTVYLEPKRKLFDSTNSDEKGIFSFILPHKGLYMIYCEIKIDTIGYRYDQRKHILVENDSVFIELAPEVYCEYSKYRNHDFCPVCSKKDKLLKVIYVLPIYDLENPNRIFSKKDEYWIGDCIFDKLCHARWYCTRCEKLF